jgi:hypothetical protein
MSLGAAGGAALSLVKFYSTLRPIVKLAPQERLLCARGEPVAAMRAQN